MKPELSPFNTTLKKSSSVAITTRDRDRELFIPIANDIIASSLKPSSSSPSLLLFPEALIVFVVPASYCMQGEIKQKVEIKFNELEDMCQRGELEPEEAYEQFKKFKDEW
ncbi:hypothetical protein E2542_SST27497 [Spatholobus suberectus]|nr:hypothetical protein E2542_SST27497 [Spatholobus suberectus]